MGKPKGTYKHAHTKLVYLIIQYRKRRKKKKEGKEFR